jgi:hypothetical protein
MAAGHEQFVRNCGIKGFFCAEEQDLGEACHPKDAKLADHNSADAATLDSPESTIGTASSASLFFTLPTRLLTGQRCM